MSESLSNILSFLNVQHANWLSVSLNENERFTCPAGTGFYTVAVLSGTAHLSFKGEARQDQSLSAGDIAIALDGSAPIISSSPLNASVCEISTEKAAFDEPPLMSFGARDGDVRVIVCRFELEELYSTLLKRMLPELVVSKSEDGDLPVWFGAIGCDQSLSRMLCGVGGNAVSCRLAEISLIQVIRTFEDEELPDVEQRSLRPQITRAVRLMNAEPMNNWTVESLARAVGMSRSSFSDVFGQSVGETPVRHLLRIRMKIAAQILRCEGTSLSEIAYRVGYSSDIALNRAFKRFFGMTPSEYRNNDRSEPVSNVSQSAQRADADNMNEVFGVPA